MWYFTSDDNTLPIVTFRLCGVLQVAEHSCSRKDVHIHMYSFDVCTQAKPLCIHLCLYAGFHLMYAHIEM